LLRWHAQQGARTRPPPHLSHQPPPPTATHTPPATPQAPNGNWSGTTSAFTGKINHHEGGGRPFKDGFDGAKGGAEAATAAGEAAQGAANEVRVAV